MEEINIWDLEDLSKKYGVTFIFDKNGLIISTTFIDQSGVVPAEKGYARRFENVLLANLDISMEELVGLVLDDRDRYQKEKETEKSGS